MGAKDILQGRFVSMESDVADATPLEIAAEDQDVDQNPIDTSETVESEMLEAAPELEVAAEADSETDTLLDSAESLESFIEAAQAAGKNGGWSQGEAKAIQLGIAATLRPIQLSTLSTSMVSVESFGGDKNLGRTVSVENAITDVLKQIWQAIKNGINKLVTYIRTWYLKTLDATSRLKKRAEAVKEKAGTRTGSPEEKKIKLSLKKGLNISKKNPTPAEITASLNTINDVAKAVLSAKQSDDYATGLDKVAEGIDEIVEGKNITKATTEFVTGSKDFVIGSISGDLDGAGTRLPTRTKVKRSNELLGGKCFVRSEQEHKAGGENVGEVARIEVMDFANKKTEVDGSGEFETLTPGNVISFCEHIITGCDIIIDYKGAWDKHEKATKSFISKMDGIVKKTGKSGDDKEKAAAANARAYARIGSDKAKAGINSSAAVINYATAAFRNVLAYSTSSLSQYKA